MLTLLIKIIKKGLLATMLLLMLSDVNGQNNIMYIMKSGFVEQEVNVTSDIDSITIIGGLNLMKDGDLLSSYSCGTEVDSVVFKAPAATAKRARNMLNGIYYMLNEAQRMADQNYFFVFEVASDDRLGSGGANDIKPHAIENLMVSDDDMFVDNWNALYKGIYRVNSLLSIIDDINDFKDNAHKNQIKGEALFMRAYFISLLTALHGEIPVPLTTQFEPLAASSITEIYGRIASDLKEAIETMPQSSYNTVTDGCATRWAAQALMARVYLFYTGFYSKTELPTASGGSISKTQVIAWLNDCIANSGHAMVPDYHELWGYSNQLTKNDYDYLKNYQNATGKNLKYVSDYGGRNPESIYALKFYTEADWDLDRSRSNILALFFGLRGLQSLQNTFPFAGGWGQGQSVSPHMVQSWINENPNDPRLWASVLDIQKEIPLYSRGQWDFVLETDYSQKKCIGIAAKDQDRTVNDYSVFMYGNADNNQLSHMTDLILIRFSDVLLMMSELTEDVSYMNIVRSRAGLPPVSYTLEKLQKERRYELAFEGLRWNDMRRWGSTYAKEALETQEGVSMYNFGKLNTNKATHPDGYSGRYDATKGFFPIPKSALEKSNGLLLQVPGWESPDTKYTGWWK